MGGMPWNPGSRPLELFSAQKAFEPSISRRCRSSLSLLLPADTLLSNNCQPADDNSFFHRLYLFFISSNVKFMTSLASCTRLDPSAF